MKARGAGRVEVVSADMADYRSAALTTAAHALPSAQEVSMPINTAEIVLQKRDDTRRIQRMVDDAARDAGPGGLPKAGIYHGTALIK